MPSKEAMDAAEKLVSAIQNDENGIWELYVCGIFTETYLKESSARKDERDVKAQIAMAFDGHTAALRAEVEALRLRLLQAQAVLEPISEILGEPKLGYVGSADKIEHEARVYEAVNERLRTGLALLELSE